MKTNLQILYSISGWIQLVFWIILFIITLQRNSYFKSSYFFLKLFFILIPVLELSYSMTALILSNNLFLDYFYKSIEFLCLGMYLQELYKSTTLKKFVLFLSLLFIIFQFYNAFWGIGLFKLNEYGNLANSFYLFIFSFLILIWLLRKNTTSNLLNKPDFNFVLAIFLIYITDILTDILLKFAYQQHNDFSMYMVSISRNFVKPLYLLLFLRGIVLIKR